MGPKNLKKRTKSESADHNPPKKQKKQIAVKPIENETKVSNGEEKGQALNAAQRKRQRSKIRKLAAIAKVKEEGGTPTSLWARKKENKAAKAGGKNKNDESIEEKTETGTETKKLKNRQEKRQQDGQYKVEQVNLSAEEIRLRMTEIQGRGELSKTARRKLAVFKKKLALLEGTAVDDGNKPGDDVNKPGEKKDEVSGANLSVSTKRRLRREKKEPIPGEKGKDSAEEDDPSKEKPVDIQVFEKKLKQKVALKKNEKPSLSQGNVEEVKLAGGKNKRKQKNVEQNLNNDSKKKKIEQPEPSDDDEEEEEGEEDEEDDEDADEDESEEDVAVDTAKDEEEQSDDDEEEDEEEDEDEENDLNSSQQEAEEEDDDNDDDDDEAEEEEGEKDSKTAKVESVQKTAKKEENKGKKGQGREPNKRSDQEQNSQKNKRYILFVGNIPFDTQTEDLKKHFLTKVGAVSSVRIPTKPGTQVPRGFAYVEVTNEVDYEKGLSLHHTMLSGRRINVEYTLSGSKKVNNRQELVSKNQKLHALRKAGKLAGSQKHDQKRSVRRFKKQEQEQKSK